MDDCTPSSSCNTDADNLFRQLTTAGKTAVNYVDGASDPCSSTGNAPRHVPALYLYGAADRSHCNKWVRPYDLFDVNNLPNLAFITPTLCNDGHDCDNTTVDKWSAENIGKVLSSDAYQTGKVGVFVWYDEDTPVPNMWIAPTAKRGGHLLDGAGYAGTLKAWQEMLGLPCLANACDAPDMRAAANV